MIPGLISEELHRQLLDAQSYRNRTAAVEELRLLLAEVDVDSLPSGSVEDFLLFLPRLLDDSNFSVMHGGLRLLRLLVQRLEWGVAQYCPLIVPVALRALGDCRAVTRKESLGVFGQLMKGAEPGQVVDLVVSSLKHKNSRVREDVLNVLTAALLSKPAGDLDLAALCQQAAPLLADSKRNVRHAALELFAVLDRRLDSGSRKLLMAAVEEAELCQDSDGLTAALQARRARHVLPTLSADGLVAYGLVLPKPGQRGPPQPASGADLDWVMNGGRASSARSQVSEANGERLHGYGSLGSLTDDLPLQRRIVSAGKGKNKLPWEACSPAPNHTHNHDAANGENVATQQDETPDLLPPTSSPEAYVPSFSSAEPPKTQTSRRRGSGSILKRSGSLNLDPGLFRTASFSGQEAASPEGRVLSRNPSVERTFSLPSHPSPPASFLLPSYPLAAPPGGGALTPTLPRRHADSSLSMSNTWPHKRESGTPYRDLSPWGGRAATAKDLTSQTPPRPPPASLLTSSFRRALSSTRPALPLSPIIPPSEWPSCPSGPPEQDLPLDPERITSEQDVEENLDLQEMMNSLRSLRSSAAKKRAQASFSSPDPDSPDPVLEPPILSSSASEGGLSSLCSASNASRNGFRTSPGRSGRKPRIARGSSAHLRSSVSMDFSSLPVSSQRSDWSSDVGVVGQKLGYSNGVFKAEEDPVGSSPPTKPAVKESFRALHPARGPSSLSSRNSPGPDVLEGVIGKGMFAPPPSSTLPGVPSTSQPGYSVSRPPAEAPADLSSYVVSGCHREGCEDPPTEGPKQEERRRSTRISESPADQERRKTTSLDPLEDPIPEGDATRDKIRSRVRLMLSESPPEDDGAVRDLHLNAMPTPIRPQPISDQSPLSPSSPPGLQSPVSCLTPPHHPSPPTLPPNPKPGSRLRRAPSLSRTRPSLSHSSDELSSGTVVQRKNPSESPELCRFSKPDLALSQSFTLLSSEDWEKKMEGLLFLRSLACFHADVLRTRLHDVCLCLIQEVRNLRSGVSRVAVCALADLYRQLQKAMDQELEGTARALLQKAGESNAFIRQDVDAALCCMLQHCTPTRCVHALISGGLSHLSGVVRRCAAQHLCHLVETLGAARVLSPGKDLSERILPAVTRLAQDSSQEARYFGRRMLLCLSAHPNFDKILEKYVPPKDLQTLRDTVYSLQTKGLGEMPQDSQSARGRRSLPGSGTVRTSSLNRETLNPTRNVAERTEYLQQVLGLLDSKDFRERIRGLEQLVSDCRDHNTRRTRILGSIFPVFDAFKARLQESNSKVHLCALESLKRICPLLRDNLVPVVHILVPAVVENHLNSKNPNVYAAATAALDALTCNLDAQVLLQPICTKAQFLSGKAKVDLVLKVADLVPELHPRRPLLVEQKVLPLLWTLLGSSGPAHHGRGGSLRGATAALCHALHAQMGAGLSESAATQPANVLKGLNEVLRTN